MLLFKYFVFFLSLSIFAEENLWQDKFVFKVGNNAYMVSDVEHVLSSLDFLNCVQPNELLVVSTYLPKFKSNKLNFKTLKSAKKFSEDEKSFYLGVISFFKMLLYKNTYDITVKNDLLKAMQLQASKNTCSKYLSRNTFNNLASDERFVSIMQLELFLRSRFWSSDKNGASNNDEFKKAVRSVRELTRSVSKQISHQLYWE